MMFASQAAPLRADARSRRAAWLAGALLVMPGMVLAQAAPPAPQAKPAAKAAATDATDEPEVVVTAGRLPGSVLGDIKPEVTLSAGDIRSFGVSSVNDLLAELAPQLGSGQGRGGGAPVVLLNGRRVSSFAEIRDLPSEAIARAEILPEEVALKYGYPADQKVLNIVLRQRFRAWTGEVTAQGTTEGGGDTETADLNLLRILKGKRTNLDVNYQRTSGLSYADRGVISAAPRPPYDLTGNITAGPGAATDEIDPQLSALAGQTVVVAAVPALAADRALPLAAYVPGANQPNVTNITPYHSLTASTEQFSANAVINRPVSDRFSATLNARLQLNDSRSQLGLPGVQLTAPAGNPYSPFSEDVSVNRYIDISGPLGQSSSSYAGHAGVTLDGDFGRWRLNATGNVDRSETRTHTGRGFDTSAVQAALDAGAPINPFGPLPLTLLATRPDDTAHSTLTSGGGDVLVTGPLVTLPSGDVSSSFKVGASQSRIDSEAQRGGVATGATLDRGIVNGQISLDIPIASRREGFLSALGELSANFNAASAHYSDFGSLRTIGYGARWRPIDAVNLIVSVTDDEAAPTQQQLGNPLVLTPGALVYDYVTGRTVAVTQVSGGNPALDADHRHLVKIGLTLRPITGKDLSITANYTSSQTRNLIASFPAATAEIQAAFPDRFLRDTDGNLTAVDVRPVNFAREDKRQLRWGINFSKPLKSNLAARFQELRALGAFGRPPEPQGGTQGAPSSPDRPRAEGSGPTAAPLGGGQGGGPGGGFGGRGGGGGGSRLQFAVYHTWFFRDQILIRDGVPELDLLDGSAAGSAGGQPRHLVEVQSGFSKDGFGARLSVNWQSATTVRPAPGDPGETLHFSDLGTVNLRLFANLGVRPELISRYRWMRGMRVTLSADNIFDSRQRVTAPDGTTPIGYQPALLDPLGRTIRLSVRKLFF